MHYYSFNPKDYMSKTAFLEPMEDLAYRRMLDHCYLTELPLPEDIGEIAMLIRMRSHTESIKVVLHYFFELTPQGYVCDRIARELAAYHSKSEKAKASADARWKKHRNKIKDLPKENAECKSDANALRNECESNANNKQLTNNHKPLTSNQYKYTFDLAVLNTRLKMAGAREVSQEYVDQLQSQFELYYADQHMKDNMALAKFISWIQRQQQSPVQPKTPYQTAAAKTTSEQQKWDEFLNGGGTQLRDITPKKNLLIEGVGHA
ncbi:YdaU family protein [Acinetobacter radioresistens]|uniref:YdaU family protein n=1 Tax=Acinetobacter radioresistens TaxID=40216 RepID=UPI0032648536